MNTNVGGKTFNTFAEVRLFNVIVDVILFNTLFYVNFVIVKVKLLIPFMNATF